MEAEALLVVISTYVRFVLGGVFIWAGVAKLRELAAFERSIQGFSLVARQWTAIAARAIPILEFVVGVLLVLGLFTYWASVGSMTLMVVFTTFLLVHLFQSTNAACLCFGAHGKNQAIGWWTIHRNVGLMILSGFIMATPVSMFSLDAVIAHQSTRDTSTLSIEVIVSTVLLSSLVLCWLLAGEWLRLQVDKDDEGDSQSRRNGKMWVRS